MVISNALTDDLRKIEVNDSNARRYTASISGGTFLSTKNNIAKAVKSLRPDAFFVSFVDCMQQDDSFS